MSKYDRTCVVCGQHYEYCTNCDKFLKYPIFMAMYCSEECVNLFDVLSSFESGQTSKEDARIILNRMDQNKMGMLKKSLANSYKKIMAEDESIEKPVEEPIKEAVEQQMSSKVVKQATKDAIKESSKNIPRSIVSKKNKY